MKTRQARLAADHVAALNLVELEFYGIKSVIDRYKDYIGHLSSPRPTEDEQERYFSQRNDLFVTLLFEIGKYLKYSFDKHDLQRQGYVPQGWGDDYNTQQQNAVLINDILAGRSQLPVSVSSTNTYQA